MRTPGEAVVGRPDPASASTGVATPPAGNDVALRVTCISTDVRASAALQSTVAALLPMAHVEAADTSLVRSAPDADCVILSAGGLYTVATSLARELRARGYAGPLVLVVDAPGALAPDESARLGIDVVLAESDVALQLPEALVRAMRLEGERAASPGAAAILTSLRRARTLMAAGEIAAGLQHSLNNPLAALLAEAQLLELEPLSADHRASVRRMVELCRRLVEVTRSIRGIGIDPPP